MTGDNNGKMAGSYDWPLDHDAYLMNAKDVVRRLRNHPSLVLYGGGNELFPIPPNTTTTEFDSGTSPPQDIDGNLRTFISRLDGSRPYVSSSVTDVGDVFDPTRSLGPKDGPYGILNENLFFDVNPGFTSPLLREDEVLNNVIPSDKVDIDSPGRNIGFQTEIGSVSHPELESLKRFLSPDAMNSVPVCGLSDERSEAIHREWIHFKYLPFTEASFDSNGIDHICQFHFPKISNDTSSDDMGIIEDYTWSAQLAQYFQYKSLFEGYSHRMLQRNSAVFFWKSSSPAPTFRGALYDWYLGTNGGYWGARSGLGDGKSIRVLLNLRDWSIHVVNAIPWAATVFSIHWRAYSLHGELVGSGNISIPDAQIDGNSVTHLEDRIPWVGVYDASAVNGIKLQDVLLYRFNMTYEQLNHGRFPFRSTSMTATNSYYLTDPDRRDRIHRQTRFSLLGALRKVIPKVQVYASCREKEALNGDIKCTLRNTGNRVAIMLKLSLTRNSSQAAMESKDRRILPTYLSSNYITLLPGEYFDVEILLHDVGKTKCSNGYIMWPATPETYLLVSIDGWNVQQGSVRIACDLYH
ncbi:hypothetical protein HJC23_000908 [Cyclotella cryptica]|uniref:Exo-beta-D-glucosaminidase Ig-fold domain-containing protein n=1 Tax=Cyclotella cryptica TaxID=29204 RepID=A0ABD3QMG8_9STRA|eukprot:CCRYP_004003-RA/>CCRYP_004003-RA protein AED:0.02 eAED:0.02 QI:1985/1/1/1/1/1/3/43/577